LPGPPLSEDSLIERLLAKGVNVAITTEDESAVRNGRFELGWVCGIVCRLNDILSWSLIDTTQLKWQDKCKTGIGASYDESRACSGIRKALV